MQGVPKCKQITAAELDLSVLMNYTVNPEMCLLVLQFRAKRMVQIPLQEANWPEIVDNVKRC